MKPVINGWSFIKQLAIVACTIVLLSIILTTCTFRSTNNPSPTTTSNPKEIVTVDQLLENPKNYPGFLCVEGIVSEVLPEQKMFTIIDNQEYLLCGTTGCALLTLPVQWAGEMPHIEDAVQITGEVHYQDRNLVFTGQKLDIIHKK